jgi:trk system potassium uptake protein
VFFRLVRQQILRIHSPHAVAYAKYEGRRIGDDVAAGVVAFFAFYVLTCGLLAVALDLVGLDLETAISGAVTAVANVGPGVGPMIGPAGNFAAMEPAPKILLALGMYLGRLEMISAFVLLTRSYWRAL